VVPVVTISDGHDATALAAALLDGGLPCAEITLRTPAGLDALRQASTVDGFTVGAGTVLTEDQARQAIDAGARFLVTPGLSGAVLTVGLEAGVPVIPGVATPTEAITALTLGLHLVKFFPAAAHGGPAGLAALAAAFPDLTFMPTGGITAQNMADYLAIRSVTAVGGTWITAPATLDEHDFPAITQLARAARAVAAARTSHQNQETHHDH
jgi:2-dehydro-3-deoxyphosphogluconate aldolase/(4S)-4-hydroxy-2-oxoglutarate aldolase